MSNPYIISMMKHPDPEPVIAKTYIDMIVTIIGFDENDDITEFDLDSYAQRVEDPDPREKDFCKRALCDMVYGLVNGFSTFALSNYRFQKRLQGEDFKSLVGGKWAIDVFTPDGRSKRFNGPIEGDNLLSDYPEFFVQGCRVRAYSPKYVMYGFKMSQIGVTNYNNYKSIMSYNSNMNPMETNVAGGRDVE